MKKELDFKMSIKEFNERCISNGQALERKIGVDNRLNMAVLQLDKNTLEIINEFHSISDAARTLKLDKGNIAKVCSNSKTNQFLTKYQTCGGFKWKFKK